MISKFIHSRLDPRFSIHLCPNCPYCNKKLNYFYLCHDVAYSYFCNNPRCNPLLNDRNLSPFSFIIKNNKIYQYYFSLINLNNQKFSLNVYLNHTQICQFLPHNQIKKFNFDFFQQIPLNLNDAFNLVSRLIKLKCF